MSGEIWEPGEPIVASGDLPYWTVLFLATHGTAMEKKNNKNDAASTNEQQLFLETKNRKIRSNGKLTTPRAEEGYFS
jgi:hypothetical protein